MIIRTVVNDRFAYSRNKRFSKWSFAKFAGSNTLPLSNNNLKIGLIIFIVVGLFSGCAVKKYVPEDTYLVNKYILKVENKPAEIENAEIRSLFRPPPNKKTLGIRFKLHSYFRAEKKPTKFNKWRNKNFGEEPVYYDPDQVDRIAFKMERYLDNVGFFHSKVTSNVEFGKKIANVTYTVKPAKPYYIKEISYDISDSVLAGFFYKTIDKTLVKENNIYNAYTFDDERDRITNYMRNVGYYYFNRNYIQFIVDSSFSNHEMTVVLKINNVKKNVSGVPDQFVEVPHRRYFIKDVSVIPDWKPVDFVVYDTVPHQIKFWDDTNTYMYNFLLDKKKRIKPSAFNSAIRIQPGQPYTALGLQQTYRRLFNFRIIRTATISFDTTGAGSSEDGSFDYMNSRVQMQTAKLNTFQAELEGTNSSGDLGIRGSVGIANRNIFKRADVLSVRLNGGFEAQSIDDSSNNLFNTFEAGIRASLFFPRFLFPFRLTRFHQRYNPTTNINFGFNYQVRPLYKRNLTNADLGYAWDQTKQIRHLFTLINLNYVNITITDSTFKQDIQEEPNQRLREQYSDHFIAGMQYSFIFNNQNLSALEHFDYFRTNLETAGNFLSGVSNLFNAPKATDENSDISYYQIGGVRYAQYVRGSFDYRHYYYFANKTNSLVFRVLFGIAIPYGNSTEVPYEKGFFAGGANDMRGWEFRKLGPGGVNPDSLSNNYERVGDMQLETNIEYRFTIYKFLKGAFFFDVGNIWTLKKSNTFPKGEFNWNTWYQQLAVDAGFGVRLDFQFFIFRVDAAVPLVDPGYSDSGEQVRFPIEWNRTVFNFGIGYPF